MRNKTHLVVNGQKHCGKQIRQRAVNPQRKKWRKLMNELYTAARGFAGGLMIEFNVNPLAVAAIFSAIGLEIYKSSLSEEDFNATVDNISDTRLEIKSFEPFINWNQANHIIH